MRQINTRTRDETDKVCIIKGFKTVFEVAPLTRNHPHGIVRAWLMQAADQLGAALRNRAMSVECSIWGR
ncbi:MAG: hypothetical protein COA62_08750 [Rhodobiaceae bacterium]|nr:MAG: hypothetical protein COA62_08750 [Rhodobiaceae bacterium]